MDDGRTLRPVHHDQLKHVAGAIRSQDEKAERVFFDLLNNHRIAKRMLYVLLVDAMAKRRSKYLH
ncbi:MAG: hypothetical protein ACRD6W_02325 [Nitrososphaerales archaeon]